MNADGTIKSTSDSSTIGFNADFFELLKQYGYSSVSFTIGTDSNWATVVQGDFAGNRNTTTVTSDTISKEQSYTARMDLGLTFVKSNVTWTLSNVTFS